MCGIIAILRRPSERPVPTAAEVTGRLDEAIAAIDRWSGPLDLVALAQCTERLVEADALLRGAPGAHALVRDRTLSAGTERRVTELRARLARIEAELDSGASPVPAGAVEVVNAAVIALKDATWAIGEDRLRTARAVFELAGSEPCLNATTAYTSIQQALSALDRLEVRGRDSAGLHVLVSGHDLDLDAPGVAAELAARSSDPVFGHCSLRVHGDLIGFVYKAAAEIGELGDNTRVLRDAIRSDGLLRLALAGADARAVVLGHTRWASVGIISESNAHPLNSDEAGRDPGPYVVGVLNGDVDNYADLKADHGLSISREITTDAKVIPTLMGRAIGAGATVADAFRQTVAGLEGSLAIGASAAAAPHQLQLSLRGSGQAIYIGLAADTYIVASEPYGVVEEADRYLRMDGETPADDANPNTSRGQVVVLDADLAGTVEGISRVAFDGTPLPVAPDELSVPEITTRDIDRGSFSHYLLKEISESPASFRKTLRGKLVERDGALAVELDAALTAPVRAALAEGRIRRIAAIGQGTAAVAAEALVAQLAELCAEHPIQVESELATELSGFHLRADMTDTLVVAVSQSGTTTDTNRTVDLVRGRGASVVAIVNRRGSDLTDKSDGILYTSDGRDVEMSVPSTKAFYAQIAAGVLLAYGIAAELGVDVTSEDRQSLLASLRSLPDAMERTLELRGAIGAVAREHAPSHRYWAIVGNGFNRIAARELRIKLSELCYKAIAYDVTEDKKHIDLSSEPLIIVCAAGLSGSNADDVAKEVGIYRAHRATPIVIATEGEHRFSAALAAVHVPAVDPRLAYVLSAMVGHLFGYEAALAVDGQAVPLRRARAAIEAAVSAGATGDELLRRLRGDFGPLATRFFDGLRAGHYDGHLEASTATRLASLFRYSLGIANLSSYQLEYGKVGTPGVLVEDLTRALSDAIDELTRPIDAIKHQAKTVTVGISRSDETLLAVPLVAEVLAAGAPRDRLSYDTLRSLSALDPAVAEATGFTRYRIESTGGTDDQTITVVDRGGIALDLPLRTERNPMLRGTKKQVASERRVLAAQGRGDGRLIVIVPEVKDNQATGITLLHVRFERRLSAPGARSVLAGYRNRYSALRDAVMETEPSFRDDLLATIEVATLLTAEIGTLSDRWRSS